MPYQTSSRDSSVAIRAGGPFEATVNAIVGDQGRALVIASWIRFGHVHWHTVEVDSFGQARTLGHSTGYKLAVGTPPDPAHD